MRLNLQLIDQFNSEGIYLFKSPDETESYGSIKYTPGTDETSPVALMLSGYRGDTINGHNSKIISQALIQHGVGVLALNYSGFDHYGNNGMRAQADSATVDSNIDDVKLALSKTVDRPLIVIANSYSINVAMQIDAPNITDIIAISPFPNFIQERVLSLLDNVDNIDDEGVRSYVEACAQELETQGYFIYPAEQPLKITSKFIDSARGYDAYQPCQGLLNNNPQVTCLYNTLDTMVTEGHKLDRVPQWMNVIEEQGLSVARYAHESAEHGLTDEMLVTLNTVLARKLER